MVQGTESMFEYPIGASKRCSETEGCAIAGGVNFGKVNDDAGDVDTLPICRDNQLCMFREQKRSEGTIHRTQPPRKLGGVTRVGNCLVVISLLQIAPSHL